MVVIGGGRVLDPAPPPGRPHWPVGLGSELAEARLVALAERRPMGIAEQELPVLLGLPPAAALQVAEQETLRRCSGAIVHRGLVDGIAAEALALVLRHQEACPAEPGLSLETVRQTLRRHGAGSAIALADALRSGRLLVEGGFLRTPDFGPSPSGGDATIDRVVRAVDAAGLSPPSVAELETELRIGGVADALRLAARQGRLVPVERDRYYAPAALERFVAALREIGGRGTITPAAAREVTGLSRKFLIPLLEWADQRGITRRAGEARILVRPN
jgi:selenocysteine-specific elongation factor